jgi:hypothetical protein
MTWRHKCRRARHGASIAAPDYARWHGIYEVWERFSMKLIPQARQIVHKAEGDGKRQQARAVGDVIDAILKRPEHSWFESK